MAKKSYTIAEAMIGNQDLTALFLAAKGTFPTYPADLDIVFQIALDMRSLFPGINITGEKNESRYLQHWVKSYIAANSSLPSCRLATPM